MASANDMEAQQLQTTETYFSNAEEKSDVILLVDQHRFHVHRSILVKSSPVFERMFSADFIERTKKEIPLPGKQVESMKYLLFMIYSPADANNSPLQRTRLQEDDEAILTEKYETGVAILALADEYQIATIVGKCEDFFIDEFREARYVRYLNLTTTYNQLKKLRRCCFDFFAGGTLKLKELKYELRPNIDIETYADIMEKRAWILEDSLVDIMIPRMFPGLGPHHNSRSDSRASNANWIDDDDET